jgi:Flp pilus assembly protein TadG
MAAIAHPVRGLRGRSGAELIEFALVLPLLLFVIAGIIDFGFLFQSYEVVTNAAREGARVGVLPGYDDPDIQARVASYVTASGLLGTATVTVARPSVATGGGPPVNVVAVTVTYPHSFTILGPIGAWFGGTFGTISLRAVSSMRAEVGAGTGS